MSDQKQSVRNIRAGTPFGLHDRDGNFYLCHVNDANPVPGNPNEIVLVATARRVQSWRDYIPVEEGKADEE